MHVKGIEIPGYEPRTVKGYGLSYAVSNIGSSHMYARPTRELSKEIDPLADEGKGEYIASVQKEQAVRDCILECVFGDSGLTPELRNQMLVAASGFEEFGEPAYLEKLGERIVTLERAFNVREGFSRKDDTLPSRFLTEPLEKAGPATGEIVRKLDNLLDEYYAAMGYTHQGIPTVERLRELQLGEVAEEITKFVRSRGNDPSCAIDGDCLEILCSHYRSSATTGSSPPVTNDGSIFNQLLPGRTDASNYRLRTVLLAQFCLCFLRVQSPEPHPVPNLNLAILNIDVTWFCCLAFNDDKIKTGKLQVRSEVTANHRFSYPP